MKISEFLTSSSPGRWYKRALPLALLAAGVTGVNYALRRWMQRPLPQHEGSLTLAGLRKPVEIIRDKWGVPHIYAQNERDLFFTQGFVHAQDRLFQMDINRRFGSGRLSEIIGPLGIKIDRFARIFGWPRAASAQVNGGDPETRAMAEAYAAGVNAFIALGKWPAEFSLLVYQPLPWELHHSAAWGVVLAWGLSINWEIELLRTLLVEELGPQKAADLTPSYEEGYQTILSDNHVDGRLAAALVDACHQAMAYLPLAAPVGHGIGSNSWVVNGQRTRSGRPILANDPHLPPIFPAIWYQNHLVGGRYNVTGFTSPGVPGVIIGHNQHLAWGVTNAFPDVQDIYIERFHPDDATRYEVEGQWEEAEIVTEVINVRGRKPMVEKVRYTRHGPVISDLLPHEERTLALRWSSYEKNNHMRAILETNRASGWDSFCDSLRHWGFPSQNIVYADTAGNIGYIMPGMVPIRAKGDGLVPVPGWNSEYEWQDWIPFTELPQRYNPLEGVIVTANNRVVGSGYPHLLSGEWMAPYRAQRILQLLNQARPLTLEDHIRFQNDTVSPFAQRFIPLALPLLACHPSQSELHEHALQMLQTWNFDMHVDSVAASLFNGLLTYFMQAVIKQAVGGKLAQKLLRNGVIKDFPRNPFPPLAKELAIRWLESQAPDWVGDVKPLVYPAFAKTIGVLQEQFGNSLDDWCWGNLHQIDLHNHLSRIPALGRLWKPLTFSIGGDIHTINQADSTCHFPPEPVQIIASCRVIFDVGAWDDSLAALPGGQSGHPASPHYQDRVADWRHGRYHPMLFSRRRIEEEAAGTLILHPER